MHSSFPCRLPDAGGMTCIRVTQVSVDGVVNNQPGWQGYKGNGAAHPVRGPFIADPSRRCHPLIGGHTSGRRSAWCTITSSTFLDKSEWHSSHM